MFERLLASMLTRKHAHALALTLTCTLSHGQSDPEMAKHKKLLMPFVAMKRDESVDKGAAAFDLTVSFDETGVLEVGCLGCICSFLSISLQCFLLLAGP